MLFSLGCHDVRLLADIVELSGTLLVLLKPPKITSSNVSSEINYSNNLCEQLNGGDIFFIQRRMKRTSYGREARDRAGYKHH